MISLGSIGTISTIFAGAATTWVGVRKITQKSERLRDRIAADVALLDSLPSEGTSRVDLQAHIDESVVELVRMQQRQLVGGWDPYGVIWAVIFAALCIGSATIAVRSEYRLAADVGLWAFAGLTGVFTLVAVVVARRGDDKDEAPK